VETLYQSGYTKDGYLGRNSGRIIIYDDCVLISNGPSIDHNGLLRAFASRYRFPKDEVISNAMRLYYTIENGKMIVSECRRIDGDMFERKEKYLIELIQNN
jgi:hypothetical protein